MYTVARTCQEAWGPGVASNTVGMVPQRRRRELAVPGYASGFDAPLRATADALERARHARSIVLVEGISDQIAVETLASLQARDLTKEGVAVVPIVGALSVSKFLAHFRSEE